MSEFQNQTATSVAEAREILKRIGLPVVIIPSFAAGCGHSIGVTRDEEFDMAVMRALDASPVSDVGIFPARTVNDD